MHGVQAYAALPVTADVIAAANAMNQQLAARLSQPQLDREKRATETAAPF